MEKCSEHYLKKNTTETPFSVLESQFCSGYKMNFSLIFVSYSEAPALILDLETACSQSFLRLFSVSSCKCW
jgi:hypothetical protein